MISIMKKHQYLQYTNLLFIICLFYFLLKNNKPKIEYVLAFLLVISIIFSQVFWNNPIQHSKIHKMDAIIAKITVSLFILYTLIYKFNIVFLFLLVAIAISFYFSNYYSTKEWCCNKHLLCHGSLHIFCFNAMFYTFS
jgi:hypothetical protein